MFAYISGSLENKSNNFVVVETAGIGYRIFMPTKAIENLPDLGEKVKIHTYYYVREDNISLYGFNTLEELRMFELLISVSGIGAKSALTMLSEITPSKFALDIISNDISSLVKVPGIGNKTAQRIILELKDKIKTESSIPKDQVEAKAVINNNNEIEESIAALQVLGYTKKDIEKALAKIEIQGLTVEDIIRKALNILGG